MNNTFQSRARPADRGVRTPVSTISRAPATEVNSIGASPKEADRTTAARISSAFQVFFGCGARLAASCHRATNSLCSTVSASGAVR